jgi:hypothetical protein
MGKLIIGFKKIRWPSGFPASCPFEILEINASSFVPYTANFVKGRTKDR